MAAWALTTTAKRRRPPTQLWAKLLAKLDARGFGQRALMIEPGRSLVGNAGVCLTEVLYLKPGEQKNFCIVDAAMNDLPRPAMYQAFHQIVPLKRAQRARSTPGKWSARSAKAVTGLAMTVI